MLLDIFTIKSPYSWVIFALTQPQVANQKKLSTDLETGLNQSCLLPKSFQPN